MFENCTVKGKKMLNPIIDWSTAEVWEFLNHYNCKSNPLYECGYTRIGCIGCPMSTIKNRLSDFERYPKYKDMYIRAFDRMIINAKKKGKPTTWETGEEVFTWWLQLDDYNYKRNKYSQGEIQMSLEDYEDDYDLWDTDYETV